MTEEGRCVCIYVRGCRRNDVNEWSVGPVEVLVQLQFKEHEQEIDANERETWKTRTMRRMVRT